jgi:hypothetical protein
MVKWQGRDFDSAFAVCPHSLYWDNFTSYLLADIRLILLDKINSKYFTKNVLGTMTIPHLFTYVMFKPSVTYKADTMQNVSCVMDKTVGEDLLSVCDRKF